MKYIISIVGMIVQILICYLLSTNRKAINWRLVSMGIFIQLVFAFIILKTQAGKSFFKLMNDVIVTLLSFTSKGAEFVFGNLASSTAERGIGFCFATQVLPTIIFFSSFMAIMYYLGVMQYIIKAIAIVMQKTMGTSGAESLSAAANIFVGQTEAPLVVRPFIERMTLSELHCIMVGGMATIAGGVMAAYVGMMKDNFPEIAGHLLAASVMSAPAALVFAKILVPETEKPETLGSCELKLEQVDRNIIDAAARGASEGMTLAINVAAMLIAFIALINLGNSIWQNICYYLSSFLGINLSVIDTLEKLLGIINAPLAWLMGVETKDLLVAGQLLGEKTVLNEFVAYAHLADIVNGKFIRDGAVVALEKRTWVILTYACCGFANFGSIGIQLGGIGALAPNRRHDLAHLGIRALIAGTFASYQTANIAGLFVE